MESTKLKTPISYYGGKQKLAKTIIGLIPKHNLYCEPFFGGGAVFFNKPASNVEVINDTNNELINFYKVVKNDFASLEKEIQSTLHSRILHRNAWVIYNNPDLFSELKRAWAIWVLATQSFSGKLNGAWGYDIAKNTTSKKINNKRESFTEVLALRLQRAQIECTDALRIIKSRDTKDAFFYCDPPYFNSDCGHYKGYTSTDFETLLKTLSSIKGKFLLSSYPSPLLNEYAKKYGWQQCKIHQTVSVANVNAKSTNQKQKIEVLTANYPIKL
jgi:DNA adenine methylase